MASRILKYVAFSLMAAFGLFGTLFVAGYAFEDPGGWSAVLMTAAWVVPMAGLSVFAALRPEPAGRLLVVVTVVLLSLTVLDALLGTVPRDEWGPVGAVAVLALGVALAFLGLHRPALAGLLMIVLALTYFVVTAVVILLHGTGALPPGPPPLLTGSSGAVVLPLLVVGALYRLSANLARRPPVHSPG